MAVVNIKSDTVTALDADVRESVNGFKHGGHLLISKDTAEVAASDDDGSVFRVIRIPSNASLQALRLLNDAITGGTDYDVGVYQTALNGGAVVDADLFGSAISVVGARTLPLDLKYEAGIDIANGDTRLWEQLGLTEDPHRDYDICITANTIGSAAGTVGLECFWSK